MADDFNIPEAPASSDSSPAQSIKDAALTEMAKSEDASNYIAEREARDAEARGEQANGEDRTARIREALSKAREETQQARQQNGLPQPPDLDAQLRDAESHWAAEQEQEQTFEQERELARGEGRLQAVAEDLKQRNPAAWREITDTVSALSTMIAPEQSEAMRRELVKGDARESLAVVHRLTQTAYNDDGSVQMTPADKLAHLASLPAAELADTIDQCRKYLQLEHSISKKYAAKYVAEPRRHTRAPAPFRAPRGGAAPPRDLAQLAAKSENPRDYIKMRQQQMKNRDE